MLGLISEHSDAKGLRSEARVLPCESGDVEGLEQSDMSAREAMVLKELCGTGGRGGEPRGSRSGL